MFDSVVVSHFRSVILRVMEPIFDNLTQVGNMAVNEARRHPNG